MSNSVETAARQESAGVLAPGATIGILGSGQLGRMTALAAAALGYRCHVFGPEADAPAVQVTDRSTVAAYDDQAALAAFARSVDVISYEFENIPFATVAFLAEQCARSGGELRPKPEALRICQNRIREKDFCSAIGVPVTPYAPVANLADLERAVVQLGRPAILKTAEMGYDGKGQTRLDPDDAPEAAWNRLAGGQTEMASVLESFVDFRMEISVIVARGLDGACATYIPVENRHRDHILHETIAPARIAPALAAQAEEMATRIARELDLVGLLAVEMFVTADDRLMVNELAPRPHNSGHWSLDACVTSQFEQFVRAIAGLPLGSPARHSDAVMTNLLGDEIERWPEILQDPNAKLHLYGKAEARAGRKMGHVTRLLPLG